MAAPILTQQIITELLTYSPDTGEFTWKPRDRRWFTTERSQKWWNARFANTRAGGVTKEGYRVIRIFHRGIKSHRLAWLYVYGVWPKQIDHINHNRADNRIINLRDVCHLENTRNQSPRRPDLPIGVYASKRRWKAIVGHSYIGLFKSINEAAEARELAAAGLGYHPNHGKKEL